VTGEWRELHNEELDDLYSSPSIIRIIKARRMRWAGNAALMGKRRRRRIDFWWERHSEGGQDVGRWMDLVEVGWGDVD
jgi:hypothetical protein